MEPRTIKVLSFNIHKGFSTGNLRFTLDQIKQSIQEVSADVVFLQEVQGQHELKAKQLPNWPTSSQFEYLADSVWPHFAYGKNAIYDGGHHGNAILSKFPIESWDNYDVSTNQFESRGVLHAAIRLSQTKLLHAVCLHFNLLQGGRTKQIMDLCKIASSYVPKNDPLLIAGDFNDWRKGASRCIKSDLGAEEVFKVLFGNYARSFPSQLPIFKMDRIYFRGLKAEFAKVMDGANWRQLSDHMALYAEFVLQSI